MESQETLNVTYMLFFISTVSQKYERTQQGLHMALLSLLLGISCRCEAKFTVWKQT